MLTFMTGCCLASFCTCLAERLLVSENIATRSHCNTCYQVLVWYQLIPIFSYCFQKGRCAYCYTKIPRHLVFIELLGGISCILFISKPFTICLLFLLIFLSIQDAHCQLINIWIAWSTCLITFIHVVITNAFSTYFFYLSTFLIVTLLIFFIKRGWLGSGDLPIILAIFFSLSLKNFSLCLMLTSCSATAYLSIANLKKIPLIPFLTFGYWLVNIL